MRLAEVMKMHSMKEFVEWVKKMNKWNNKTKQSGGINPEETMRRIEKTKPKKKK